MLLHSSWLAWDTQRLLTDVLQTCWHLRVCIACASHMSYDGTYSEHPLPLRPSIRRHVMWKQLTLRNLRITKNIFNDDYPTWRIQRLTPKWLRGGPSCPNFRPHCRRRDNHGLLSVLNRCCRWVPLSAVGLNDTEVDTNILCVACASRRPDLLNCEVQPGGTFVTERRPNHLT